MKAAAISELEFFLSILPFTMVDSDSDTSNLNLSVREIKITMGKQSTAEARKKNIQKYILSSQLTTLEFGVRQMILLLNV